jgi:murein DD-endopeptidase MepM/ murein hydrolase activator NlpD
MRFPQARRRPWTPALLLAAVLGLVGSSAQAQGDLEKTPWATGMVYPVGDPQDFQRPAPGEERGFSISRGVRGGRDRHEGVDLSNRGQGGQVRAIAPGLVVCTRTDHGSGWGNMVVLAHRLPGGEVLFSLFAHLKPGSIAVREGEVVALGQPVGKIGNTGRSTGPHLHLEFRTLRGSLEKLGQPLARAWERAAIVDPLRFFPAMLTGGSSSAPSPPPTDPAVAIARGAGLSPSAAGKPDGSFTRGELYRFALSQLEAPGAVPAKRWTDVRHRLTSSASKLPADARAHFLNAALPRREADTRAPAGLQETVDVLVALTRFRPPAVGGPDSPVDAGKARAALELAFPQALPALEPGAAVIPAAAWRTDPVGPPAVSRRQAAALWTYLEGSPLAARPVDASASAVGLP